MKLLIVEDDADVLSLLVKILEPNGFTVATETNGKQAEQHLSSNTYDFILLDIMLPGQDGIELLKHIRAKGITTPVILLTAIGTSQAVVEGLNCGADDYIVKPFKIDELKARINSVLRRSQIQIESNKILNFKNLRLNDTSKKVWIGDEEVKLTSKEFNMLKYFIENQGQVLSREKILGEVWNINFDVGTNVVDVYVNYLRKKLKTSQDQKLIETVVGMGYVMR